MRITVELVLRHGGNKQGGSLFGLLAQEGENRRFAVEIINDDIGVERIHRLLHTRGQVAVGLIPVLLDIRDHILGIMRPGAAGFFPDGQTFRPASSGAKPS